MSLTLSKGKTLIIVASIDLKKFVLMQLKYHSMKYHKFLHNVIGNFY